MSSGRKYGATQARAQGSNHKQGWLFCIYDAALLLATLSPVTADATLLVTLQSLCRHWCSTAPTVPLRLLRCHCSLRLLYYILPRAKDFFSEGIGSPGVGFAGI